MVTINLRTLILKKIRKRIRQAISWYKVDEGLPNHWTTKNYKGARFIRKDKVIYSNYPYYVKSDKAIEKIAEKILKEVEEYERKR